MAARLDMIGIVCRDTAASLRFYGLLDLPTADLDPNEPYVEVATVGGLRISWNHISMVQQIDPDWQEPVGQRMSLAFLCDSPGKVDELYRAVVEAGFEGHKEPWDAFWGQRYAVVVDPDGNKVDLFCPL